MNIITTYKTSAIEFAVPADAIEILAAVGGFAIAVTEVGGMATIAVADRETMRRFLKEQWAPTAQRLGWHPARHVQQCDN